MPSFLQDSMQLLVEMNRLTEERRNVLKIFRKEGRGGISSSCSQRGTAIQRKTKSAHVTMSGFLLFQHMCQNMLFSQWSLFACYATHLAKRSWAKLVTPLHFLINCAANDLTGERFRTTAHICTNSFWKWSKRNRRQIHFFLPWYFFLLCNMSYMLLHGDCPFIPIASSLYLQLSLQINKALNIIRKVL